MADSQEDGEDIRRGVLLFNLGGPESLEDVRPFLFNLFSDPEIIRIKNNLLRKSLAWIIATTRQRKSRGLYRQIGGGSPLRRITDEQATALAAHMEELGCPARVYVGMRCWKPTIGEAVESIRSDRITHLVTLPLFPQFSVTTTGSCLKYFRALVDEMGLSWTAKISDASPWYDNSLYVESMADLIRESLGTFWGGNFERVHILYSAHSIPAIYVKEGDPYLEQTRRTVASIDARLGNIAPSLLAFQSKVGPVKWLEPSTKDTLKLLGQKGVERVLAVPVSFVSDHIETLQEIDILYKRIAAEAGIKEFHRVPAPNLYPKFIKALASIAIRAFG